jgi:excisionase family DNA binding protein
MTQLLDKKQVSESLAISERTLERMVQQRKIAYVKVGKLVRFHPSTITQYIDKRTIKAK